MTKAALPVQWQGVVKPMLHHVLDQIPHEWSIVIGTTDAQMGTFHKLVSGGYKGRLTLVSVGGPTQGQADTLLKMSRHVDPMRRAVVVNCDNVFLVDLRLLTRGPESVSMLVHESTDPACSYVDQVPNPTRFAEKRVISRWALSGAWGFLSSRQLGSALGKLLQTTDRTAGEFYLSTALNYVGGRKSAVVIGRDQVLDWGTPAALAATGAVLMERAA